MASAAPQKRMVSSVFITLTSPYRATVTQHQHTRTHNATANDMPHAATRVSPGDSSTRNPSVSDTQHGSIRRRERTPSESQGSAQNGDQSSTPSLARPSEPRTPSSPVTPDLTLGPGYTQQQTDTAAYKGPGELLPPPPPPPVSVDTELTEDLAPLLPPPPVQEPPTASILQPVSPDRPTVSEQPSTALNRQPEQRTPSSGGGQKEPSQEQLETVETKEVCGFCRKPVALSETAIEALNRTYHASCFQCRQCHIPLAGKLYYNKAGIPLCEDCYQASLELCWACGEVIKDHVIRALERAYHPPCFVCATCSQPIGEQRFAQGEVGEVYCLQDYYRKYAPQCSACQQLIIPREDGTDSYTVECLGRSFHEDCYRCEVCSTQLSPEPNNHGCHPLDGRVLCKSCHLTMVQSAQL
ncbi:filamin-binding LIM protein 1 [Coregonus clupeaformis]|uniref:filamin-binding LIM protein 1 n=1 Tax=Coregonus clupeaformis TaxID=59861 RepID=UPI001E1C5EE9|nr:filamin-binding LIM protein 1 [Coregonus clupeaformis]